jgi:ABC-2 type transport system permease protein
LSNIPGGPLDLTLWPVTMLVASALSRDYLALLFVLVGFFASEILWKDREVGLAEISDAVPVADGTAMLGRFLAIVGVLAIFLATSIVAGMMGQLGRDYYDLEPTLYIRVVFGMNFAAGALIAVLMMAVSVVVNNKYLGVGAALLALAIPFAGTLLPHYLLTYGADPGSASPGVVSSAAHYSYMNGFGPYLAPFVWFKLYSVGWALLLGVVASALWVRGRETGIQQRLRQARDRFTRPLRMTALAGLTLVVTAGGFILYNTNVLNALDASETLDASRSDYVERYRHVADVPQPSVEHARVRVEIRPEDPAADISGSFRLVNRTARAIDSVHVTTNPRVTTRSISFDRPASPVVMDSAAGYRLYALTRALAPGDSIQLSFELRFRQRGFPNSDFQTDVIANGTRFSRDWLPFVGYRGDVRRESSVHVETVVSTAGDQLAVAPGALRREWTENGRRHFHYDTEVPRPFAFAVFSGRYAVRADRWIDSSAGGGRGVKLGVYHHPEHDRNLDTFVRAMKASLSYYSAHFGPYAGSELRMVETPRYDRSARAHPGIVAFSEHAYFARVQAGQPDQVFFATAHEVAHQWWGGRCVGAPDASNREGYLWEMLANYSALMATEKALGADAARRLYAYQMDKYFTARGSAPREVAVLDVQNEPQFRRALLAMYAMRSHIGDEAVNLALRRFADKHRASVSPSPSARDVHSELRAVTADSLQYLLTDLFETATVWNIRAVQAVAQPTGTGEYRVTLDVAARKLRADAAGRETEVAMDDWIDVGLFSTARGAGIGEPFYLQRHRIRSGEQTITITVPKEPVRVEIDPYRTLLERYGGDNVAPVRRTGIGS